MSDVLAPEYPGHTLLKSESVEALRVARENIGAWVIWQSDFSHSRSSKVQAYNLNRGKRQKTLVQGRTEPDSDERLEFKAWKNPANGKYCVIARFTTAEFRVLEREVGNAED